MKRKLTLFTGALLLALAISVGSYAYTFNVTGTSLDATAVGAGFVTHETAPSVDQPEWDDILPAGEYDQEVLRPDGPGDQTQIQGQFPSGGAHWDKVDDTSPDDWDTYIYTMTKQYRLDLYNLSDHVEGANVITGVTVYFTIASDPAGTTAYASAVIKTGGVVYEGTTASHLGSTFATYSHTWTNNPATGQAWTWDEIDALQAGVDMAKQPDANLAACTQVYVLVDYQLPPIIEGEVPEGDIFIITPHPDFTGDMLVNIYLTNTGLLKMAYQHLNIKLYVADSLEAEEDPEYRVLSLENGVASFNIEGGSAASYTVQVTGGGYALISGDPYAWGEGWTHVPEFYCEVTQR